MLYWSENMNLTEWKDRITEFFNKIKNRVVDSGAHGFAVIKGFRTKVPSGKSKGAGAVKRKTDKSGFFTGWFRRSFGPGSVPEGKRRVMIFAIGGFAALFLILIIAILALNFGGPKESSVQNLAAGPSVPSEDLFIPAEPDFLPQFLPEREPRRFWTLDDIRPYWKNPEDSGQWRGEIRSAVDKLMEGVP